MRGQRGNREVFISKVLAGEFVGLVPAENSLYEIYYGPQLLGWLDEQESYFTAGAGAELPRRRNTKTNDLASAPFGSQDFRLRHLVNDLAGLKCKWCSRPVNKVHKPTL